MCVCVYIRCTRFRYSIFIYERTTNNTLININGADNVYIISVY